MLPVPLKKRAEKLGRKAMYLLFGTTVTWEKFKNVAGNNFELGKRHFYQGNMQDAVFRFKIVTWLQPENADAWYFLGRSFLGRGKRAQAQSALRKALALNPQREETAYLLAMAEGKRNAHALKAMPPALLREHFDILAADFTREQLDDYHYAGHTLLMNALRACVNPGNLTALELGPGSGLCGEALHGIAANVTGVDISQKMLNEAARVVTPQGRKAYDTLVCRELHEFLREVPAAQFDVVLASNVASYIGDLSGIFQEVARVLKQGGVFAFTADQSEGAGWNFDAKLGRFRFGSDYLQQLAAGCGLTGLKFESGAAYPDYPVWVCVFRK